MSSNKLIGAWKLDSSENFDEYMKAVGKRCRRLACIFWDDMLLLAGVAKAVLQPNRCAWAAHPPNIFNVLVFSKKLIYWLLIILKWQVSSWQLGKCANSPTHQVAH